MKAFTLFELVITMFVLTILFSISFKTPVFQKTVYYLPQETNKLAHFLRLSRDVSLTNYSFKEKKLCAAGLQFENNTRYQGVVYLSEEEDCEFLFQKEPSKFSATNAYLLDDGSVDDNLNNQRIIKKSFLGGMFVSDQTCRESISDAVIILFINPYGEPAIFSRSASGWKLAENIWPVCIVLKYQGDERKITINQLGQILLQ